MLQKKRIECIQQKSNYKQWVRKERFENKKFRSFERKQERIERAILLKKYENKEEFFRFKSNKKQIKLQKIIKKLSVQCKKTKSDLDIVQKIHVAIDKKYCAKEKKCKTRQSY